MLRACSWHLAAVEIALHISWNAPQSKSFAVRHTSYPELFGQRLGTLLSPCPVVDDPTHEREMHRHTASAILLRQRVDLVLQHWLLVACSARSRCEALVEAADALRCRV